MSSMMISSRIFVQRLNISGCRYLLPHCSSRFDAQLQKQFIHQYITPLNGFQRRKTSDTILRFVHSQNRKTGNPIYDKSSVIYMIALGTFMLGMAYAAVPLYRIFCQATGRGGTATLGQTVSDVETMKPRNSNIRIHFEADTVSSMQWQFKPQQKEIVVKPGETALAFYKAQNVTDKPIVGISTYNVLPFEAGRYFNKIQVDMPVFFYIDPSFNDDPLLEKVDSITLSYTFFDAKDSADIPLPGFMQLNK